MDHSKEVQRSEVCLLARQGQRHCDIVHELCWLHGVHALSSMMMHRWMSATFTGRRNFTSVKTIGRPTKLTPQMLRDIRAVTREDPTITICQLSVHFGLGHATIHRALRSVLKLCKHLCIMRPHQLTAAHCHSHLQLSHHLLGRMHRSPNWAGKVITADELWMFAYNATRRQQSCTGLEAGEPQHPKVRHKMSTKKLMLVAFWDACGVVHQEFIPQGRSVNAHLYRDILRRMRESVRCRQCELWRNCCHQFWL